MLERRNSARLSLSLKVREKNGDYLFSWTSADLSEDGLFLINKFCYNSQEPYSRLTLTLPCGHVLHDVTARVVRESRSGERQGCGLELMNLSEDDRMALKRLIAARAAS